MNTLFRLSTSKVFLKFFVGLIFALRQCIYNSLFPLALSRMEASIIYPFHGDSRGIFYPGGGDASRVFLFRDDPVPLHLGFLSSTQECQGNSIKWSYLGLRPTVSGIVVIVYFGGEAMVLESITQLYLNRSNL
jgi:hypothetical protein